MTHTPGPWRVGEHGAIVSDCPQGCRDREKAAAGEETHEVFYGGHFICESVTGRDARLIAAAPELLAALEALLPAWCHHEKNPNLCCELCKNARAAIAKTKA